MAKLTVAYHYERPKYVPSNPQTEAQTVHVGPTSRIVVDVTPTTVTLQDGSRHTSYTESAIRTALTAGGVTAPGGMSVLKIEGYAAA